VKQPHVLSKRVQLAVFMTGSRAHCVAYCGYSQAALNLAKKLDSLVWYIVYGIVAENYRLID